MKDKKEDERIKSVKTNGKKCEVYKSTFPDCHCNECYRNITEYLGKKKGEKYKYTGKFAAPYFYNQEVVIDHFSVGDEITHSCEAFIQLFGGTGGQVEWIPRNEIINNLT